MLDHREVIDLWGISLDFKTVVQCSTTEFCEIIVLMYLKKKKCDFPTIHLSKNHDPSNGKNERE